MSCDELCSGLKLGSISIPTWSEHNGEYLEPAATVNVLGTKIGVALQLGGNIEDNPQAVDLFVERRPRGWAIIITPPGSDDPAISVYVLDSGRVVACQDGIAGFGGFEIAELAPREIDSPLAVEGGAK